MFEVKYECPKCGGKAECCDHDPTDSSYDAWECTACGFVAAPSKFNNVGD